MKVYGIGWLDGDGNGLALWKGDVLYTTLDKAKKVFAEKIAGTDLEPKISEDGMTAGYDCGIIEFEVSEE